MTIQHALTAFLLTLLAGLTTVIGGTLAISVKKPSDRMLSIVMGFSAGMMLYVSFTEILPESSEYLEKALGHGTASWTVLLSFFIGIAVVALTDRLLPHHHQHEETGQDGSDETCPRSDIYLYKTGMATMLAIGLHNFPEGLGMFSALLQDLSIGLSLVLAVSLHNIPVGMSISAPIYKSTGSRLKAVWMSLQAGLYTPLGALIGFLLLRPFLTDLVFGILMGAVAGIMLFVAINEIYPASRKYAVGHSASYALIGGMLFMAIAMQLTHTH